MLPTTWSSTPTRRPPPARVAEATDNKAAPNAVLEIVAIAGGQELQRWQSKARWEGPLPRRYTATRAGAGWRWDAPEGRSIRVQTDARGAGGKSVEAWAGAAADRIVIHAHALDDVTIDADAEADAKAPGHARKPEDAWDGSPTRTEPGGRGEAPPTRDKDVQPSPAGEELADDFERELGLEREDAPADGGGAAARRGEGEAGTEGEAGIEGEGSAEGEAGGAPDGRTGDDTRIGGTGPGGDKAKPGGDGKGSEGGKDPAGSEGGSRDGKRGGDEQGMYGGNGRHGDRGVPSAIALFGGLLSVPAALRGFVELALILSSADLSGAGAQLFQKGLGKIASAAAARKVIAHEARAAAVRETKLVIQRVATDKRTASAWSKATAEERRQATRIIYWELQRKYFKGYLDAAKQAKAQAQAALRRSPKAAGARQSLDAAELAEEAATVQPVAGRLPQNHEFAGKQFPRELLPPAYRKQGLRFTDTGFPDFEPFAMTLPNGKKYIEIRYTGKHSSDFKTANNKAGYMNTPGEYTWHHSEDLGRMYLVPKKLHDTVRHTGGVATYKHVTGDITSYVN